MSEVKKTVELKDEELEKVNGGFSVEEEVVVIKYKVFTAGDCFQNDDGSIRVKVIKDYKIPVNNPEEVSVYWYTGMGPQLTHFTSTFTLFNEENFVGNNVW